MTSETSSPTSTLTSSLAERDRTLERPRASLAGWTDLDVRAVDTARVLAADAVR